MATADKPKTEKPADAKKSAQVTPEAEASARINVLQESIKTLEGEIKTLAGRFANRNPARIPGIQKENKDLQTRLDRLEKALYGLLHETLQPRNTEEMKLRLEILKNAATEYFKKANINPDLWKNVVY